MISASTISWPEFPVPEFTIPGLGPDSPVHDVPGEPVHWLILLPVAAALATIVLVRRSSRAAAWFNAGFAFLAVVVAAYLAYTVGQSGDAAQAGTIGTLPFGELSVPLELRIDRIQALIAVLVALIGFGVQVFARWYLWFDPRYRVFASTVSITTAGLLLLVVSDDVVLTLAGWQVLSWATFLLIGHSSTRDAVNRSASRTLIITRIADAALLLGLVALAVPAGTTSITGLVDFWTGVNPMTGVELGGGQQTVLAAGLILVVVGVLGRAAQFPFQDWLPDSIHAPTPATALLHSVTVVGAAAVVLISLLDVLPHSTAAVTMLAFAAAISTVGGALLAFVQPDLKRALAWSTTSQAGLVLGALVLAAQSADPLHGPDGAVAHLTAHGIGKALLFLTIGWLAVLTGGTAVVQLSGTARLYRSVRAPMAIGLLSVAGVPPTIGFLSAMLMIGDAERAMQPEAAGAATVAIIAAMGAAVPLTAAYCMRAWLVLSHRTEVHSTPGRELDDFFEESDVEAEAIGVEEAESAISSTARLVIVGLMIAAVLGGLLLFTPALRTDVEISLQLLVAAPLIMVCAAAAVWVASRGVRSRDAAARIPAPLALACERGLGMGRLYRIAVATPVLHMAHGVQWLDREVIDGYVRGTGHAAHLSGELIDRTDVSTSGTSTMVARINASDTAADGQASRPALPVGSSEQHGTRAIAGPADTADTSVSVDAAEAADPVDGSDVDRAVRFDIRVLVGAVVILLLLGVVF